MSDSTPPTRAPSRRLESRLQGAVVKFCRHCIEGPHFVMAFDRSEARDPRAHLFESMRGIVEGTPDMVVLAPGVSVWMELKAGSGKLSEAQAYVGREIAGAGHRWACVRSVEEARLHLLACAVRLIPAAAVVAMHYDANLAAHAVAPAKKWKPRPARPDKAAIRAVARARARGTFV